MKRVIRLVLPLIFVSCSTPQVISFVGTGADPKSYLTYRVEHPEKTVKGVDQNERTKKVQNAIDLNMKSLDYTPASITDLTVKYNLILSNTTDVRVDDPTRYGPGNRNPYPYYTVYSSEYTEGTLLVEVRETYTNKLVWQASMDLKYKPGRNSKNLDPVELAFTKIFAQYPYRGGSDVVVKPDDQK